MLRFISACLVAALCLAFVPAIAGETPQAPTAAQMAAWIRALDAEDYAARETAGKNLVAAGQAAIGPVAKAMLSESAEVAWRASGVLEQIGVAGDEKTLELVSQAIEEVNKSGQRSQFKALSDVHRRWRLLRHERAVEQIAKLGGRVHGGIADDGVVVMGGLGAIRMMPAIAFDAVPAAEVIEAIIDEPARLVELGDPIADSPAEERPDDSPRADEPPKPDAPRIETPPEARSVEAPDDLPRLFRKLDADGPKIEIGLPEAPATAVDPFGPEAAEAKAMPAPGGGFFRKIMRAVGGLLPFGGPEIVEPPAVVEDIDVGAIEFGGVELAPVVAVEELFMPEMMIGGDLLMAFESDLGDVDETGLFAVQIGKGWTGGTEGFKLLRDVMQLTTLELSEFELTEAHVAEILQLAELRQLSLQRCRFDRAAIEKLKTAKPALTVLAYGEAVLGISGEPQGEGFHVSFVAPGSGAERAGIQAQDVISRIDGEQLRDFEHLTHMIAARRIGDKASVEFLRQGKKQTVEVTLRAREETAP